jgi:hypothetical protein
VIVPARCRGPDLILRDAHMLSAVDIRQSSKLPNILCA